MAGSGDGVRVRRESEKVDESDMTPAEILLSRLDRCKEELDLQWLPLDADLTARLCRDVSAAAAAPHGESTLPFLTSVYLGGCELGDESTAAVMHSLHECCPRTIRAIDLMFNQLTHKGVHAVVDTFVKWGSHSPTFLGLSWNDFGDAGVRALLPLLSAVSPTALHTLSLSNCLITQQGGGLLGDELANSVHMKKLILTGNPGITAATLANIQRIIDQERLLSTPDDVPPQDAPPAS
eukprot:TRINITY_DN15227_c0_g1_i1.p2 TRINITY_DN15227_c0_g1~~TRINITY_DN15227_c0_g1_i1.p2  ORF type:complete len:237 (+),score=74.41 TRINITY_DN15227_c0_g1_i1:80-790(+)